MDARTCCCDCVPCRGCSAKVHREWGLLDPRPVGLPINTHLCAAVSLWPSAGQQLHGPSSIQPSGSTAATISVASPSISGKQLGHQQLLFEERSTVAAVAQRGENNPNFSLHHGSPMLWPVAGPLACNSDLADLLCHALAGTHYNPLSCFFAREHPLLPCPCASVP